VHEERPVGDVLDLDAGHCLDRGDDLLDVVGARSVDGDVADLLSLLDANEVDCAQVAACLADRAGDLGERAGAVVEMNAQGGAEGCGWANLAQRAIVAESQ
jgi:hypothetical protein